jgi:hypothetical protein
VKYAKGYLEPLEPLPDVLVERKDKDEEWTEEGNKRGLKFILPSTNAVYIFIRTPCLVIFITNKWNNRQLSFTHRRKKLVVWSAIHKFFSAVNDSGFTSLTCARDETAVCTVL